MNISHNGQKELNIFWIVVAYPICGTSIMYTISLGLIFIYQILLYHIPYTSLLCKDFSSTVSSYISDYY